MVAAFLVAVSFIGMLVNRNLEIQEQRRSVQLRESELLAADAEEALLAGDALRAIESAVSALPKAGEEDRPYYAPAERVLMEATDILGGAEAPVLLKNIALEQMTPIVHFCLSPDGRLAVTIDDYGILHCFDTVSEEELWTDVLLYDTSGGSSRFVTISKDGRFLICNYYSLLECRDPATGQVLWSHKLESSFDSLQLYDHQHNRIALIRSCFRAEHSATCLELTLLDAQTGRTLTTLLLDQAGSGISYSLGNILSTRMAENGVFSEDGQYLACAFFRTENDSTGLACFVVDLQNRQVVLNYRQELAGPETYYVTGMDMRDNHLLLALESSDDSIAATVMKLDWHAGKQLWSTTTPAELNSNSFSMDQTSSVLFWDTIAIVGRYEKLYAIDLSSGALLNSVGLPNTLNSLHTVSSHYFAYSLADGTYAIGWYNLNKGFVLSTDPFYQVSAEVGPHFLLKPHQGGIVQMYSDGDYFELSVSNVEQEGYLALVGSETRSQLTIKRPITVEKPVEQTTVTLPVEQKNIYCSGADSVFCDDHTLLFGSFYVDLDAENTRYFYAAMDRQTHQITRLIDIENDYGQQVHFLPDGSGYLRYSDGTTWLNRTGVSVPIAEKKDSAFSETPYNAEILIATDTVRLTGGNLLTAHCDSDSLILMVNGTKTADLPLPPEHCYEHAPEQYRYRQVFAGRNGSVLTICHERSGPFPAESMALYRQDGSWLRLPEEILLSNTNALAFSSAENRLALADDSNQIRLIDLTDGTQAASFPLQLPSRSVLFMDFILEDSFLLVKTKDAQVLVYDLRTGAICYHSKLGSTYTGTLNTYVDAENRRLYIIDSNYGANPNCLCVDLRSWTTLGTGSRVFCFDEGSGELFHFDRHYDGQDSLSCMRIPGTGKLVQLGQQMLSSQ